MLNEIGQNYNEASNRFGSVCNRKGRLWLQNKNVVYYIACLGSAFFFYGRSPFVFDRHAPHSWRLRLFQAASGRGQQLGLLLPNHTYIKTRIRPEETPSHVNHHVSGGLTLRKDPVHRPRREHQQPISASPTNISTSAAATSVPQLLTLQLQWTPQRICGWKRVLGPRHVIRPLRSRERSRASAVKSQHKKVKLAQQFYTPRREMKRATQIPAQFPKTLRLI